MVDVLGSIFRWMDVLHIHLLNGGLSRGSLLISQIFALKKKATWNRDVCEVPQVKYRFLPFHSLLLLPATFERLGRHSK